MRRVAFKFELLRQGAFCALLRAAGDSPPRIRMQADARIKMSLTADFGPFPVDVDGRPVEADWLSDEIRPVLNIDGTEYSLGVYIPTTVSIRSGGTVAVHVEAYDRTQRVLDTNSAAPVYFPAGTNYLDAVEQLLTAAGIETVFKTDTAAALTEAREDWDAGTPFLEIANDLLTEINYSELWFDNDGAAVLEPAAVPDAAKVKHILDAADPETLVIPGHSRENDYFSAPNVFEVYVANPEKPALMRAVAINDNPQSPLSTVRRGRQIVSVTRLDNIADQASLQAFAERLRNDSLIRGETINVSTGLQPGWGVGDVVALHIPARRSKFYGPDGTVQLMETEEINSICVSRAFDMELCAGGRMTHTLEKVVYALDE